MKVVVRSSSLLFFLVSIFLGLPVHRRNRRAGRVRAAVTETSVELTALNPSTSENSYTTTYDRF